jgi:hypothetical protein
VATKAEPDRNTRARDDQALEEIRRLFARYRQIARHGQVIEREQPDDSRDETPDDAPALAGR